MTQDINELVGLYRAAGSGELPALAIVIGLLPSLKDGKGLDEVIARPQGVLAAQLSTLRQVVYDSDFEQLRPVVLSAGLQAVAALSSIKTDEAGGPDVAAVREWLEIQADAVARGEAAAGRHNGPDTAVIAMCIALTADLDEPGMRARSGDDPAAAVLDAWAAAPGADVFELQISAAWFAAVMLGHAFGHDWDRLQDYLHTRTSAIYPIADRLRRRGMR